MPYFALGRDQQQGAVEWVCKMPLQILYLFEGGQSVSRRPCSPGEDGCLRFISGQSPLTGGSTLARHRKWFVFFFFLEPGTPMQLGLRLSVSTEAHDCKASEAGTRQRLCTIQCLFNQRKRESC